MFQKLESFTQKVADLADKPSLNPTELKAQFDAAPDEVRVYFNNLIDALKLTTAGDSGAKNVGATAISGLTGTDVQSLLESLNTLTAKKTQESWTTISLVGGWINYGAGFSNAQYVKDQFGFVTVKGLIKGGNGTEGIVIFNLPTGYRPPSDEIIIVPCFNNTTKLLATLRVKANGDVAVDSVPANTWLSLSGIKFKVD